MTKLGVLRHQLASLRRSRQVVRWGAGVVAPCTAALWVLAVLFALDVAFELNVLQRAIMVLLGMGVVGVVFYLLALPLLSVVESDLDMALMVERQQAIDSDLVAALQFELPAAPAWGSRDLETAVIDYVAQVGRELNVFEGFSRSQLVSRGLAFAITIAVVVGVGLLLPGYTQVFFNRLLLGSRHYPTATVIERITVNGEPVLDRAQGHDTTPRGISCAQGQPVELVVECSGVLPIDGKIVLWSRASGRSREEKLERAASKPSLGGETSQASTAVYAGSIGRLGDAVYYKFYLGDAWTDPAPLTMIPLPIVEMSLAVTVPDYARSSQKPADPSAKQVSVLEGSAVVPTIRCTNKKSLAAAWLVIKDKEPSSKSKEEPRRYPLVKQDEQGFDWQLDPAGTPFADVRSEFKFEIQITDQDGLRLPSPIEGQIRLKPDRPPTGSASVVHKVLLPTAKPRLEYRANDDYGIARLLVHTQVERRPMNEIAAPAGGTAGKSFPFGDPPPSAEPAALETPAPAEPAEEQIVELPLAGGRIVSPNLPAAGYYDLSLASLTLPKGPLVKGDRLKLTLEVVDYRGRVTGASYLSEPLVLEISDESGVLAAISEADARSEERLSDIIKQQLGIGESP